MATMSVLFWVCVLAVCGAAAAVCALWWRWRRARSMLAHLPSLPSLPLIGNTHLVYGAGENLLRVLEDTRKLSDETNLPVYFKFGPLPMLFLIDAVDIKTISTCSGEKPYIYGLNPNTLGKGLLTAPDTLWKHTSKKLIASFSPSVVDGYQDLFNRFAADLVESLKTEAGEKPFDALHKYIGEKSFKTIYEVTIGSTLESESGLALKVFHTVERMQQLVLNRWSNPALHLDLIYWLSPTYRELAKHEHYVQNLIEKNVYTKEKGRDIFKELGSNTQVKKSAGIRSYLDILQGLSETDPIFTPKQIQDEIFTIIGTGHETVANALMMCFMAIGSYPNVQETLYKEMREIFGDSKRAVSKEDLSRMRYCEAVINETLRLYPTAPLALRLVESDIQLKSYTVPKDTICGFNLWGAGRSRRAWGADAALFRPERWLDGAADTAHFIPFSTGKRTCIGKRYAMAILKTALAHCVRELVLQADISKLRLATYISLQPVSGSFIQVQLRN